MDSTVSRIGFRVRAAVTEIATGDQAAGMHKIEHTCATAACNAGITHNFAGGWLFVSLALGTPRVCENALGARSPTSTIAPQFALQRSNVSRNDWVAWAITTQRGTREHQPAACGVACAPTHQRGNSVHFPGQNSILHEKERRGGPPRDGVHTNGPRTRPNAHHATLHAIFTGGYFLAGAVRAFSAKYLQTATANGREREGHGVPQRATTRNSMPARTWH